MLDRVLLLESMRRDASLIWEVLTNPLGSVHAAADHGTPYTYSDLSVDVGTWAQSGGGPVGDYIQAAQLAGRSVLQGGA
jgi:hypothetical protein